MAYSYEKGKTNAKGQTICGAKTRSGKPCQKYAMANGRCKLHGGKSLKGAAAPSFKHGRYSKYIPKNLEARYANALSDPQLLELNDEIALLDARLTQLLERIEVGESHSLWLEAQRAIMQLQAGVRSQNRNKIEQALIRLDQLVKSGLNEYRAWHEVESIIQQRARLVESQRRRAIELEVMIQIPEVLAYMAALSLAVRKRVIEYVPDEYQRPLLQAVTQDFERISHSNRQEHS